MTPQDSTGLQINVSPPARPTLTFTPTTSVSASTFTILDSAATVTADATTPVEAIRVSLSGTGTGVLGVVVNGVFDSDNIKSTIGKIDFAYDGTTKVLSLTDNTGNTAVGSDFQTVLRSVAYSGGAIGSTQGISINLGRAIYSSDNGHYYEFIKYDAAAAANTKEWIFANTAANDKNFLGLAGYLATVTSDAENKFMNDRINEPGWIGGSSFGTSADGLGGRVWKWAGGPEMNTIFWTGNQDGASGGKYANWATGEPNNNNSGSEDVNKGNTEPYAHFLIDGKWNDYANDRTSLNGYWVEYSTKLGTGDDGLGGTRKTFNVTVADPNATGTQNPAALDLVFYNPATGQISFAFVGAENNIVKAGLTPTDDTPNLAWNRDLTASTASGAVQKLISADVDVDKDGIKDFITRNSVTGQIVVLFGENRTSTQRAYAYNRFAFVESGGRVLTNTQDWTIDFASNKLGANDTAGLLWRNAVNGSAGVGGLVATVDTTKGGGMKVVHTPGSLFINVDVSSGWYAVGDGEFNTNSTTREVLWRSSKTNEVVVWSYNAARSALADAKFLSFGGVAAKVRADWTVIGINNVDATGNDEIIWQKGVDVAFWRMAANNFSSGSSVTVGAGDRLKDIADVDKDGILDLVGQNDTDGTIGFYTLTTALAKKVDRVTYTLGQAVYKPGKGTGNPGLELVSVDQYDTISTTA